jgi:hypothetical protein
MRACNTCQDFKIALLYYFISLRRKSSSSFKLHILSEYLDLTSIMRALHAICALQRWYAPSGKKIALNFLFAFRSRKKAHNL